MLFEAATFVIAALIHAGVLIQGYQHPEARTAEAVIAIVLLVGVALTWVRPAWVRQAGLAAQGLALFGTLIGLFTIAVGVGPRTVPDIVYHIGIVIVLIWGLVVAARARSDEATSTTA
jgi:multisubunit Na+/H+ antiporter MnhB subunit